MTDFDQLMADNSGSRAEALDDLMLLAVQRRHAAIVVFRTSRQSAGLRVRSRGGVEVEGVDALDRPQAAF
ncbi:hypothetical protein AB1339_17045 [Streptomyces cyaneofuscatus]|uniref:hypothetical protein n=1 Tax=Streptomyces cyaneofuscatus TaxID=66883 RepID=UPI00345CAD46